MSEEKMRRPPTHPGELLKLDVLPAMKMTQEEFGVTLGLSRKTINQILACKSPVSAETAVKLGTLFGNDPQFWLNLQSAYDLWMAHEQIEPVQLKQLKALHSQFVAYGKPSGATSISGRPLKRS